VENGKEREVEAAPGEVLSDTLTGCGIHIDMPCAGAGICGACRVSVNGRMCLACQTKAESGDRIEAVIDSEMSIAAAEGYGGVPVNPLYSRYGLAFDIGTTTLCAALFDKSGECTVATRKNPQTSFGADVMTRIGKAMSGDAEVLADCVRESLADMTFELCHERGITPDLIDAAVVTGNTVMLCLLTRHDTTPLSRAPFIADRLFGEYISAQEIGLPIADGAMVYLARCISAFVGGDITTALTACGMCESIDSALLADIGTNGEIALWHEGKLICCSTAAGPAFEGGGIRHGVYGIPGAIDHVWLESGQVACSTIGGDEAVGICGSGIIDALAVMLKREDIDETGALESESGCVELKGGIAVTAGDVRQIQLAKAAVRAGIETLIESSGIGKSQVKALYIAGGFGSFVNIKNAAAIGLIPCEFEGSARAVGNAAHSGAGMLLCDKSLIKRSEALASDACTLQLDSNPAFTENYVRYMMFED